MKKEKKMNKVKEKLYLVILPILDKYGRRIGDELWKAPNRKEQKWLVNKCSKEGIFVTCHTIEI